MSETFPGLGHFVMKQCTPNFTRDKGKGFSWFFKNFLRRFCNDCFSAPSLSRLMLQLFSSRQRLQVVIISIVDRNIDFMSMRDATN